MKEIHIDFRLLLPELINEQKCIYLDSDIVVCRDISELYGIDISDYDIGGAFSPLYFKQKERAEKIVERIEN